MGKWCLRTVPVIILGVLTFAAGIAPTAALSNISQWADLFHIPLPDFIKSKTADVWVFWLCLGLLIFYIVGLLLYIRFRSKKIQDVFQAQPDMSISDVINYMVNDSSVELKKPKPAEIEQYGPAKGHLVNWPGIGHQDARIHIQTALNNGDLESWGKREVKINYLSSFESSLRPIPKAYWESACIDPSFCFHNSDHAQTIALPNKKIERYANLMLNKKQVKSLWSPGPLWRRILMDLRIFQRKNYYGKRLNRYYNPIE